MTNAFSFFTEHRSKRFKYRYTAQAAADQTEIPLIWIWYWAFRGCLHTRQWLKQTWVRLDDVQKLAADLNARDEAFVSTREYLPACERSRLLKRWRYLQEFEPTFSMTSIGDTQQSECLQ